MAEHSEHTHAPIAAKQAEGGRVAEPCERHEALEARPEVRAELAYGKMLNRRPAVVAQRTAAERLSERAAFGPRPVQPPPRPANNTGLPDALKDGIESLSGLAMDDVRVHRNSSRPAQFDALAYAQGSDIHLAPGQERHLSHEAWHVVQQKQGRVRSTLQKKGIGINDDEGLEREAHAMALLVSRFEGPGGAMPLRLRDAAPGPVSVQLATISHDITINSPVHSDQLKAQGGVVAAAAGNLSSSLNDDFGSYIVSPENFTSAHILAKQFGGLGGVANVRPWTASFETTWTAREQEARRWVDQELQPGEVLRYVVAADYGTVPAWIQTQHDQVAPNASQRAKDKWRPLIENSKAIPFSASLDFERRAGSNVVASNSNAWAAATILPPKNFVAGSFLMETQAQADQADQDGLGLSLFD